MQNWPLIGKFCKDYITKQYSYTCDVILNLIESHEIAINYLREVIPSSDLLDQVEQESLRERALAEEYMKEQVEELYPEVLKSI
jgi:hypothetical protein